MDRLLGVSIDALPQTSAVIVRPTTITLELPTGSAYFMPVILTITPDTPDGVTLGVVCQTIHSFYQGLIGGDDLLRFMVCKPESGPFPRDAIGVAAIKLLKQTMVQRRDLLVLGSTIAQVGQRGPDDNGFHITLP